MSDSLLNDATGLVRQLLGQSRYRLDVHGCTEFLDVLKFSSVETLSQPWRFDISVTSSSPDTGSGLTLTATALNRDMRIYGCGWQNRMPVTPTAGMRRCLTARKCR